MRGCERGGRASLIDFCTCGARWRNAEKRDWNYHVGGNSLRKHPAALLRYQPGVLLCYHFSQSSGESACAEVNLITRLIYSGMCTLEWPTMSPEENGKVRDTNRVFLARYILIAFATVSIGSTYHQQYFYFMNTS